MLYKTADASGNRCRGGASFLPGIHYCIGEALKDLISLDAGAFTARSDVFAVSTNKLTPSRFLLHAIRS